MKERDQAVRLVKLVLMDITALSEDDYPGRIIVAEQYAPRIVDQIIKAVIEEIVDQKYIRGRR